MARSNTKTGGRVATSGVIPGRWALSVGDPEIPTPEGFSWTRLSDVARLESGHTPSRKKDEYWNGDIPWIGIRDATENHGRVITSTKQWISEEGLNNSSARLLPAGTVCLSRTASVGYVITMGIPMATSQDFINWVCGPQLSAKYLHYILMSEQESIRRFSHGTTHQTVYFPEAKAFHVCIPERTEQDAIAAALGALDDKIAVNERTSSVAAEIMEAKLFHSLESGYETHPLADIAEFHNRKRVPLSAKQRKSMEGPYPYYGAAGIIGYVNEYIFDGIYLLVGEDGTVTTDGRKPMTQYIHGQFWVSNHAHVLTGSKVSTGLLKIAMQLTDVAPLITGAVQPKLNMRNLSKLELKIPTENNRPEVEKVINDLWKVVHTKNNESRTLAELRDTLLPQLMSGKLRVKDAEKIVEDNV